MIPILYLPTYLEATRSFIFWLQLFFTVPAKGSFMKNRTRSCSTSSLLVTDWHHFWHEWFQLSLAWRSHPNITSHRASLPALTCFLWDWCAARHRFINFKNFINFIRRQPPPGKALSRAMHAGICGPGRGVGFCKVGTDSRSLARFDPSAAPSSPLAPARCRDAARRSTFLRGLRFWVCPIGAWTQKWDLLLIPGSSPARTARCPASHPRPSLAMVLRSADRRTPPRTGRRRSGSEAGGPGEAGWRGRPGACSAALPALRCQPGSWRRSCERGACGRAGARAGAARDSPGQGLRRRELSLAARQGVRLESPPRGRGGLEKGEWRAVGVRELVALSPAVAQVHPSCPAAGWSSSSWRTMCWSRWRTWGMCPRLGARGGPGRDTATLSAPHGRGRCRSRGPRLGAVHGMVLLVRAGPRAGLLMVLQARRAGL